MTIETIKASIRDVPDFPTKGILFKDLTTVFKNGSQLRELSNLMYAHYKDYGLTKVVGIESRGFIMGPILAEKLNAGFVPVRKIGKLPAATIEETYEKEYGVDTIQIHTDALTNDDIVLLHDDLLATGGTMKATYNLVKKFGVKKIYINFLVELDDLKGRELFDSDVELFSIIHF